MFAWPILFVFTDRRYAFCLFLTHVEAKKGKKGIVVFLAPFAAAAAP